MPRFHAESAKEGEQNSEHPKEEASLGEKPKLDDGLVYESYDPLLLKQNEAQELLPFSTFDAALDEFYAKVSHHAGHMLRSAAGYRLRGSWFCLAPTFQPTSSQMCSVSHHDHGLLCRTC